MRPLTDDELLGAETVRGAPLAVAIAARALASGGIDPSVPAICERTGYSRSQVYDARKVLDAAFPGWRSAPPEPSTNGSGPPDQPGPTEQTTLPIQAPEPERATLAILQVQAPWQIAVSEKMAENAGRRSWDLYADVYAPAWDLMLGHHQDEETSAVGSCIAIAVHYLETVEARPLTDGERALIARLVRQYGKVSLYALSRAVGATETMDVRAYYRYARAVAERINQGLQESPGEPQDGP